MEFDSLAFSASRSALKREDRVYCPACQEKCDPEPPSNSGDPPTCNVCEEKCILPPPVSVSQQNTQQAVHQDASATSTSAQATTATEAPPSDAPADGASTADGAVAPDAADPATAPSPPRPRAETPPAVRRAAVSERVAREVLNFMAAIERGESAAVGLPEVPGEVMMLEDLGLGDGGGGGGGVRNGHTAPALEQVVKDLPRIKVEENSWVLHQTVLRLKGGAPESEVSIDAVFAPFSPPPAESVLGPVVLSVPPTADKTLENEGGVKGSVLVMDRGVCTFASKALRANAAGAAAAVIVQTHDVWPYVMEDSKGEAKAGGGLDIPVCMVSKEKGEVIKKAVQSAAEGETIRAELSVSSSEKDCIVCQELFAVGDNLVRLPCGHLYHEVCLLKWLKLSNTCPYCRQELPSSNEAAERARRSRQAASGGEGEEPWQAFFD